MGPQTWVSLQMAISEPQDRAGWVGTMGARKSRPA